ncbi:MAG: hypothetical protein WD597_13905, partial [Balneolaceae bacterium]
VRNILLTAGQLVPLLLKENPTASFAIAATSSFDPVVYALEPRSENQRYRVYSTLIERFFGTETFKHFTYKEISCYLLINKGNEDLFIKLNEIEDSFKNTYNDLLNIED